MNCAERLSLLSDYRNVSSDDGEGFVGLQEGEGKVVWGWTTQGEWLLYTVTVSFHINKACCGRLYLMAVYGLEWLL